jgi:hypothetical protein
LIIFFFFGFSRRTPVPLRSDALGVALSDPASKLVFPAKSLTDIGIKMVEAVSAGVGLHQFHIHQALSDHGFGAFLIIRPLFLLSLAFHANCLVIIDG